MTIVPKFEGVVNERGQLFLDARKDMDRWLRTLAGKVVEVVIRKKPSRRTVNQNAYLHAVPLPLLAEHFGMTIAEVKYSLMGEKWGWKKDPISGREVPVKPSTSEMTVDECTEFIEWLLDWAPAEHGVSIPAPDKVAT